MAIVREVTWSPRFPSPERSPGLHLSTILDRLEQTVLGKRPYEDDGDEGDLGYALPGFAWEAALKLEELGPGEAVVHHPGEFTCDGIIMTPDAMIVSPRLAVGEWKFTWKKWDGNFYPDNPRWWRWFIQVKSYCRAMGTRFAVFKVLFICGDYTGSRPFKPIPKRLEVEFTEGELERNWQVILANKGELK